MLAGVFNWATSGCSNGHCITPCAAHQPKSGCGGESFGLHSTQIDSGTLCASHQSASSTSARPISAENLGRVQSVAWPHQATAARTINTPAVGSAWRSHAPNPLPLDEVVLPAGGLFTP